MKGISAMSFSTPPGNSKLENPTGHIQTIQFFEPHPIIIKRLQDRFGLSPSVARTTAYLARIGGAQ